MGKISRLYNYTNGSVAEAPKVSAEFENIINAINVNYDEFVAARIDSYTKDETDAKVDYIITQLVGDKNSLTTEAKATLVSAVNEVLYKLNTLKTAHEYLAVGPEINCGDFGDTYVDEVIDCGDFTDTNITEVIDCGDFRLY